MENQEKMNSKLDGVRDTKEYELFGDFLNKFELNEKTSLNYDEFYAICKKLFEQDEIEEKERRIREIFGIFDRDGDGVLKDREWEIFREWLRVTLQPVNVLIIVDVQNDFIDGSLALRNCGCGEDGVDVINPINHLIKACNWNKIIYSLDWHPENHISFYDNLHLRQIHPDSKITKENAKLFDTVLFEKPSIEQKLWPRHCVLNTWGAELHKDLIIEPSSEQVHKGQNPEVEDYSAFCSNEPSQLKNVLSEIHATHLYVCGLAYDVCVKSTCIDGLQLGYALAVIGDCCRGVDLSNVECAKQEISDAGGLVTTSENVLSFLNARERSLVMSHQSAKGLASAGFN